ncbi:MAG: DUF2442 domain-containing protein [Candidatus Margulisiibacteriota bacterium]
MNISVSVEAKASAVKITNQELIVSLVDGREVKVPLVWFPRLIRATASQRNNYRLIGNGIGIHWPKLDEDLSVAGILAVR